jgi:glycosidase
LHNAQTFAQKDVPVKEAKQTEIKPVNLDEIKLSQPMTKQDGMVYYEIFVRSFYDSNGDGIGDLNGVTEKLDYIKSLGVNGIWLMPITDSPSYHGYDVTDYNKVNPQYGTMEDFIKLTDEAHKRGIKVIMDFVINHTSSQHP